jgi:hypothetical protein
MYPSSKHVNSVNTAQDSQVTDIPSNHVNYDILELAYPGLLEAMNIAVLESQEELGITNAKAEKLAEFIIETLRRRKLALRAIPEPSKLRRFDLNRFMGLILRIQARLGSAPAPNQRKII